MSAQQPEITELLQRLKDGEAGITERLMPLLYGELKILAEAQLRSQKKGGTLQPTALVHEAFMKLVGHESNTFANRHEFFGLAARAMRSVVIDYARRKLAIRRGSGIQRTELTDITDVGTITPEDLLDLDAALQQLEAIDPPRARVVDLLFFAGLKPIEAAELLGCSERTVERHWSTARVFLFQRMKQGRSSG